MRHLATIVALLLLVGSGCSRSRSSGGAGLADAGAKGAKEEPWTHVGMEPNGWWKKWKLEDPPFPVGTRFELEAIELDGTRRPSAWVVRALTPQAGGFRVDLASDDGTNMRADVPPQIASPQGIRARNERLVAVTTPAGTFLAGRLWNGEQHDHRVYEMDQWVVPDIPFPVQRWCRPVGQNDPLHLWDPPSDGTVPLGTHMSRLVRVQKP